MSIFVKGVILGLCVAAYVVTDCLHGGGFPGLQQSLVRSPVFLLCGTILPFLVLVLSPKGSLVLAALGLRMFSWTLGPLFLGLVM